MLGWRRCDFDTEPYTGDYGCGIGEQPGAAGYDCAVFGYGDRKHKYGGELGR